MTPSARIPFQTIPLLAVLKPEDRLAIEPLCHLRGYERGEVIFREGDQARSAFFVSTGRVKIVKAAGSRDIIIEILGPGEPVGAVAAFDRGTFPATAIAMEPTELVSIAEDAFFHLLESRPAMTRSILSGLTMRLMMVNKRMADLTGSAEKRAARLFVTLSERLGTPQAEGSFIPLALSRQEIADLLGTTLETAIRLMSRWQKEGLVLTRKEGFLIPRLDALQAAAEAG